MTLPWLYMRAASDGDSVFQALGALTTAQKYSPFRHASTRDPTIPGQRSLFFALLLLEIVPPRRGFCSCLDATIHDCEKLILIPLLAILH